MFNRLNAQRAFAVAVVIGIIALLSFGKILAVIPAVGLLFTVPWRSKDGEPGVLSFTRR